MRIWRSRVEKLVIIEVEIIDHLEEMTQTLSSFFLSADHFRKKVASSLDSSSFFCEILEAGSIHASSVHLRFPFPDI